MTTKTRPCALCRQRPRIGRVESTDLCETCYEYAGWENTHSDECHDEFQLSEYGKKQGAIVLDSRNDCPVCLGVPAPWTIKEETKMTKTATRPATARRNPTTRHFSHANCSHPRTPAGRAACRKAMRAPEPAVEATSYLHVQAKASKVIHTANDERMPACGAKVNVDTAQVYSLTAPSATCKACLRVG